MKRQLQENFIMKLRVYRDVLSRCTNFFQSDMCAPPSSNARSFFAKQSERMSLCALRGSLTVEAALLMPFFLMILLACFSFFTKFASAAELKVKAAADAKNVGMAAAYGEIAGSSEITIYKTAQIEPLWADPFEMETQIVQKAVCRAWIGFTELEISATYVYITPKGSVYHLYRDCTHLNLSIQCVTFLKAGTLTNEYGQNYRPCELCGNDVGTLVYITSEGDCYHSDRTCSGLKRTVSQVPISHVGTRSCCLRCMARKE